jgi:tetratricopeptide (TPR) repeat protein
LGVIAYRRHDLETAKTIFTRMVDTHIENPKAWNNLGIVLEELGDTSGAMSAYFQAISFSLPHESADARHNLYTLRFKIGRDALLRNDFEMAVFNFAGAVDLLPSAQGYYHLSLALALANQTDLAFEQLDKALEFDPKYDRAIKLRELLLTNPSALQADGAAPLMPDSIR